MHDLGILDAGVLVVGQSGVLLVTLQEFNFRYALVNLPNEAPRLWEREGW